MIDYAEALFASSMPEKDGVSHRARVEGLIDRARNEKRREELEAEIVLPPFPVALEYLWCDFLRLRRRAGSNGFGSNTITWEAIGAYIRLGGRRLAPREVEVIEALDDAFLAAQVTGRG